MMQSSAARQLQIPEAFINVRVEHGTAGMAECQDINRLLIIIASDTLPHPSQLIQPKASPISETDMGKAKNPA